MHVPLVHQDKYLTIGWNWDQSFIVQLISEYLATLLTFLSSCSLFTYCNTAFFFFFAYVLCQKGQSSVCNAMYENKIYSSSLHILERDVVKIDQMILHLLLFDRILVIVLHCMAHRCQDFSLIGKVYSACK